MRLRLVCICCMLAASAAAADDLDDVMHRLAARQHAAASFVERQYLELLKRPLESSGRLVYDAPDRLEKITQAPHAESLLLDGDRVTVTRGRRSRVLALQDLPQLRPLVESLRATLQGDRRALERSFRPQFSGTPARWTLELAPLDPALAKIVATVRIEGANDDLLRIEIRQADGDRSVMTLQALGGQ